MRRLLPIVEGQADIAAVQLLTSRILKAHRKYDVNLLPAQRRGEYPTVLANFENYFQAALKERAAILWVLDFDCRTCDCPVHESERLLAKAAALRPGWPMKVAFLVKEYEALFLADEQATRSVLTAIDAKAGFPPVPEAIRGAKQWLSQALPRGMAYKEMVHQKKITEKLDLDHLRQHSPSYAHLERAILHLIDAPLPA